MMDTEGPLAQKLMSSQSIDPINMPLVSQKQMKLEFKGAQGKRDAIQSRKSLPRIEAHKGTPLKQVKIFVNQ
jgi:hypothetical protein